MLEQYYRINQVAGIYIHQSNTGAVSINACGLIAKGNQLDIAKKVLDITNIEDLKKHFSAKNPIALNLSGKGILYKQIEKVEIIDQSNFNQILPNANIDDFYVQNFVSGENSFVSIIRKTEADRWINQLTALGFTPMQLSLGVFPAQQIFSLLNVYGNEIKFNGHIIKRNEQQDWLNYHYNETELSPFALKIESEGIHEKLVLPYAAAFQLILANGLDVIDANVPSLAQIFISKQSELEFKVKGAIILGVFFVLLLINFVVFSVLNSSNIKLTAQVSRFTQSTSTSQEITQQIKQKEALLQSLGWDGGINKSSLIDQIAALMPEEVSLKEVTVNPIDLNTSRTQKILVFFNRKMNIIGSSDKIIPVNEWIARMKIKPWVKNIQLESYMFNSELNTGQFIITLNY